MPKSLIRIDELDGRTSHHLVSERDLEMLMMYVPVSMNISISVVENDTVRRAVEAIAEAGYTLNPDADPFVDYIVLSSDLAYHFLNEDAFKKYARISLSERTPEDEASLGCNHNKLWCQIHTTLLEHKRNDLLAEFFDGYNPGPLEFSIMVKTDNREQFMKKYDSYVGFDTSTAIIKASITYGNPFFLERVLEVSHIDKETLNEILNS